MNPQTIDDVLWENYERVKQPYDETIIALRAEIVPLDAALSSGTLSDLATALAGIPTAFEGFATMHAPRGIRRMFNGTVRDLRALRSAYLEASEHVPDAGVLRVAEVNGSREAGARFGYFEVQLSDGSWGSLQRRPDDCVRAGLASLLQAPMSELPRLYPGDMIANGVDSEEIPDRMACAYDLWMARNGVRLVAHSSPPVSSRRWLAVCGEGDSGHCVLLRGRTVILDTGWVTPPCRQEMTACLSDEELGGFTVGFTVE